MKAEEKKNMKSTPKYTERGDKDQGKHPSCPQLMDMLNMCVNT